MRGCEYLTIGYEILKTIIIITITRKLAFVVWYNLHKDPQNGHSCFPHFTHKDLKVLEIKSLVRSHTASKVVVSSFEPRPALLQIPEGRLVRSKADISPVHFCEANVILYSERRARH